MVFPPPCLFLFHMKIQRRHTEKSQHRIHPDQQQRSNSRHAAGIQDTDRDPRFFIRKEKFPADLHQQYADPQYQYQIDTAPHPGRDLSPKDGTHRVKRHKMQRRMIVILYIKINRQIIKIIPAVRGNIIPELLCRDPDRLLVDVRLVGKHFACPPVFQHILYILRYIGNGLPEAVPVNLVSDELFQPPLRLCRHDPGRKFRICKFKRQQLVHVVAFFSGNKKTAKQKDHRQHHKFPFILFPEKLSTLLPEAFYIAFVIPHLSSRFPATT